MVTKKGTVLQNFFSTVLQRILENFSIYSPSFSKGFLLSALSSLATIYIYILKLNNQCIEAQVFVCFYKLACKVTVKCLLGKNLLSMPHEQSIWVSDWTAELIRTNSANSFWILHGFNFSSEAKLSFQHSLYISLSTGTLVVGPQKC